MKPIGPVLLSLSVAMALMASAPSAGAAPHSGPARAAPASAAIDLSGLLGNENEPDENEGGDNGSASPRPARAEHGQHQRTLLGVPLGVALPIIGTLLVLGAVTALVVRWVRRYRAWKREVAFRMRAQMRRLSDDFQRARRQASAPGGVGPNGRREDEAPSRATRAPSRRRRPRGR
jgi:hypothetical protein